MSHHRSRPSAFVALVFTCVVICMAQVAPAQPVPATAPASPPRPRLGVKLQAIADAGVLITEVMVGYAAESAGLRAGDVVVRVRDAEIDDADAFQRAVRGIADGQTVAFTVVRDGREQNVDVKMVPPRADAPGARPPTKPDLRDELLSMMVKDQAPRRILSEGQPDDAERQKLFDEMAANDQANRERIKAMMAEHGSFPTISMVGQDGANAAFLIVQHADRDPEWQASMLPVLEELAKRGEAGKGSVAYLTDRVRRAQNKPQLYATQYHQEEGPDGTPAYAPPVVEDPANLDKRRLAMGLGPWKDYEAQMAKLQNREPFESVRGPGEK